LARTSLTSPTSEPIASTAQTAPPRLRFPAFQTTGGWSVNPLGRLFAERQEAGFIDLPLLSVTDRDGVIPQEETNRRNNSNADKSKYLRVVPGDIAYNTMRMWEGRSALVGLEGLVSPAYTVCKPAAGTNSRFFAFYFKTPGLIAQFRRYSQGLVEDTLNLKYEAFAGIPVGTPSPAEQEQIADCLTSLDELIAAQGRKVEALKAHKKGLMQHLFPEEGHNLPRLRFPEFRDGPEWHTVPLGELLDSKPEYGVNAPAVPYSDGLPTYLRITDIDDDGRLTRSERVSVEVDATEDNTLQDGDIALARTGASVGKSYRYRDEDGPLVFAGFLIRVRADRRRAVPDFLSSFFNTRRYWDWVGKTSARSGQPGINGSEYASLPVPIPGLGSGGELSEQQRIAACFSTLDARLAAQVDRLDALKDHKKGLMQGLFPAMEEHA
jgi:type I restriction enzyme, S subunit